MMNSPFIGPRPFEREEQDIFFGRDAELNELLSLVIAHRVILFYSTSGAGKTSLVNAKLIPSLEEEGFDVLPTARVRDISTKDIETTDLPNVFIYNTLISLTGQGVEARPDVAMTLPAFLDQQRRVVDADGFEKPRVVIFDQFEELFIHYKERWKDRQGFFKQLEQALSAEPSLRVIFSMREEYVAELDPFKSMPLENLRIRFRLERLKRETALEAIEKPVRKVGYDFDSGVAEKLVDDLLKSRITNITGQTIEVLGEYVEPVQLQVVCQNLWQNLSPGAKLITHVDLEAIGDTDNVLAEFYESNLKAAARKTKIQENRLRKLLQATFITPFGTRAFVYRGQKKTGDLPNSVIDVLQDNHLLRSEWRAGTRWYELTHDRFISPILKSNTKALRKRQLWGGAAIAVFILTSGILLAVLYFLAAPVTPTKTSVLLVDGSADAKEQFDGIKTGLALLPSANIVPDVELGLAFWGTQMDQKNGYYLAVSPALKQTSVPKITDFLTNLDQKKFFNTGCLQDAIIGYLNGLKQTKLLQQMIVITGNIGQDCQSLDRSKVIALSNQKGINIDLTIVGYGDISESNQLLLRDFAAEKYTNVNSPVSLLLVIQGILNTPTNIYWPYGYYYYEPNYYFTSNP